jgi:hypothetical protein
MAVTNTKDVMNVKRKCLTIGFYFKMNLRNNLTEEELKFYMISISATITKMGKSSFEIEVPSPTILDKVGVLMFNQEVRGR